VSFSPTNENEFVVGDEKGNVYQLYILSDSVRKPTSERPEIKRNTITVYLGWPMDGERITDNDQQTEQRNDEESNYQLKAELKAELMQELKERDELREALRQEQKSELIAELKEELKELKEELKAALKEELNFEQY
jgi:exonuclease VII large subunit